MKTSSNTSSLKRSSSVLLSMSLGANILGGCESPAHDLGDSPESRPENLELKPPELQPVAERISEFDGTWLGEAQDPLGLSVEPQPYRFPSGSTRIQLHLSWADPQSNTITFGEGAPLAPPTDPDVGYPPNSAEYVRLGGFIEPWEGYAYPVSAGGTRLSDLYVFAPDVYGTLQEIELTQRIESEGIVIDGRIQISYHTHSLFSPWCELQPPGKGCDPASASEAFVSIDEQGNCFDLESLPVDCGKAFACANICTQMYSYPSSTLSLQLTNDGLVGVFEGNAVFRNERGYLSPIGPIHFRRATGDE